MNGYELTAWWFLLVIQNASFTWVSRARNSSSLGYHAIAAIGSNGLFLLNQLILINNFLAMLRTMSWQIGTIIALTYISATVFGSVTMHWISLRYLEKGKRRVGSTELEIDKLLKQPLDKNHPLRADPSPLRTTGTSDTLPPAA